MLAKGVDTRASPGSHLDFMLKISPAQCIEIWDARPHTAGINLLARVAALPDFDEHLVATIWVEFMYQTLLFGKENRLTPVKTLALFNAVNATHAAVVEAADENTMNRQNCLRFFADQLLTATKAMMPSDRFSVAEVCKDLDQFE